MSAIQADYRTNKHIPSRKCYQLILEVPEEDFPNVCNVLGYPKTGENVYVGMALLNCTPKNNDMVVTYSEGDKLRMRAVMLSKDPQFHKFIGSLIPIPEHEDIRYMRDESGAIRCIYEQCNIKSRAELYSNIEAQTKFRELDQKYKTWQLEQTYADNLSR